MSKRTLALVAATLIPFLASSAATSPLLPGHDPNLNFEQVRAEYIDLDGNRDETNTTCSVVNKSMSRTLYLGDIYALGPDGLSEVLSIDTSLNGVGIPPLGSLELPVDSANFPLLQPKRQDGARGLESVLVSWTGSKDTLRLTAAIHLEQPGSNDNRVITRVEGHGAMK